MTSFTKTKLLTYYLAYDVNAIFATLESVYDVRIFLKQGYIDQLGFINCTSYQLTSFTETMLLIYYLAYDVYTIFATLESVYDERIFLKQGDIVQ